MPKHLVIVESPAKARTIGRYLGPDFAVESSVGHIRDIPSRASELPESRRDLWKRTRFGIDIDNDFTPVYIVTPDSRKQVARLRAALKDADTLYLATDEDREGEAIAWHLLEVLRPKVPVRRMVFHEITPTAIRSAVEHPRELDRTLVAAQEARRILDRLFGYEVSPVLWRRVQKGLSAGRVQSPAIRILVDRERERMAFVAAEYGGVEGTFLPEHAGGRLDAALVSVDDLRVATGADFDATGRAREERLVLTATTAAELVEDLRAATFRVEAVERKPVTRRPYAPFRTATLQQEAGRKLRFGARRTMAVAQRLYEQGLITYMRTDSTTLSETALAAARGLVAERYGSEYLPRTPRVWGGKVASAQEAHEAIRPAGDHFAEPAEVAAALGTASDEARLYELVWKRTVASQMKDARLEQLVVRLGATSAAGRVCRFQAAGRTIVFPGFLRAYVEGRDDPEAALDDQERNLPPVVADESLEVARLEPTVHRTQPPRRYTEAALIKRLEELGIGRPSTYASIIGTIQERGYVRRRGNTLFPTLKAFAVVGLLERYFADYVDYDFTARMERDLDRIARGEEEMVPWLKRFYFGNGHPGLRALVSESALERIDPREVNSLVVGEDPAGVPIVARVGQYGPYLVRGEDRASIPEDLAVDELTVERALELLAAPDGDRELGTDPGSGLPVLLRRGRYGPYVQLGERDPETNPKPRTASLLRSMDPAALTLDEGLRLLSLPRVVGHHPDDGEPVVVRNGRYGPYLQWGKETRSLEREGQVFTVDLEEALALLARPKRRRASAAAPLKELGPDPATGKTMVVREGRWGPYLSDGEYNVSLKGADTPDALTPERAAELLAERRAQGPAKRRRTRRA